MVAYNLRIAIFQVSAETNTYRFEPIIEYATDRYNEDISISCPLITETYTWNIGPYYRTTKTVTLTLTSCQDYVVTLATNLGGTTASASTTLRLWKDLNPDFAVTNNYGIAPLVFHVEDTTDYSCSDFRPTKWTWYIIYFGCLIEQYGFGSGRNMTINIPGIYGLKMTITDGTTTYSVTKRDIIFVEEVENSDGIQIELAHESSADNRRHIIKSTHDFREAEKNSIKFFIWGTELEEEDIAINEVAELRGDEIFFTKNLIPFESLTYHVGSELNRWDEFVGKDADMIDFTRAKILRLWSGR